MSGWLTGEWFDGWMNDVCNYVWLTDEYDVHE